MNNKPSSYIARLLLKDLFGILDAKEQQDYADWLAADERNAQLAKTLLDKGQLKDRVDQHLAIKKQRAWEAFQARMREEGLNPPVRPLRMKPQPVIGRRSFTWSKAAIWILLAGFGFVAALFWLGNRPVRNNNLVVTTPRGRNHQNHTLTLPDSSQITLNTATRIEVDTSHGKERRVILDGEAFFDVRQQADHPFLVNAGQLLTIKVLGTAFNVTAYSDDSTMRVDVVSGAVQVQVKGETSPRELKAWQTLTINPDRSVNVQSFIDTAVAAPWIHDEFNYRNAPTREILNDIGRWYDVEMVYHQVPAGPFNFRGPRQMQLSDALKRLENIGYFHFVISKNSDTVNVYIAP